jgi:hypothetical protein
MFYQEMGQKMIEEFHLGYFLDAYEWVTGERLCVARSRERPDFVCQRPDGSYVGIELTRVVRDPEAGWSDEVFSHQEYMSAPDAIFRINCAIVVKDEKRRSGRWLHPDATILVIQLMDCPICDVGLDLLPEDVDPHGFIEVWVADFTGLDAYGDIELFGVYPPQWWGHHERPNASRKPYG